MLSNFANTKRVMGIEPTYPAWKAGVLPLNYTRRVGVTGFEPAASWSQTRRSSQAEPHPDGVVLYHFLLPLRDTRHIIYECQLNVNNFFHFFIFSSSSPETLEIQGFSGLSLYGFRYSCVISIFPLSSICMSI